MQSSVVDPELEAESDHREEQDTHNTSLEVESPLETLQPSAMASQSRWFSLEFIITYLIFIPGFAMMFKFAFNESEKYNTGEKHVEGVVPGWFMGRKMDLSDSQWNTWRNNMPILIVGMASFLFLSDMVRKSGSAYRRVLFYNAVSLFFIVILHGVSACWVLLISIVNFLITRTFGHSKIMPVIMWAFNLTILWTSYTWRGYRFEELGPQFAWLDEHRGLLAWEGYFKISMLRFISYGMDYHWMRIDRKLEPRKGGDKNKKPVEPYFAAAEKHLPAARYDWWHFFAYIFYVPLYIAGPIASFNAWCYQVYNGPQSTSTDLASVTRPRVWKAIARLIVIYVGFEIWLHYCYLYAINEHDVWKEYQSFAVCITAFFVLNFMYTKFLIIWRFFRVVSMFDGIDVPENMNRCVNNNFTFVGFWRSWHASFNKWTVRYMYIPMGGAKNSMFTIWLIFTFIGLWHDLWLSWVAWALLNCVFFSFEMIVMHQFNVNPKLAAFTYKPYWRHILALAGALNVFLLMVANLAILHGFTDSVIFFQRAFVHDHAWTTFFASWIMVAFPVLYMLEIREGERRQNDARRY